MDVIRLGLPYDSTYKPDALIEGYSSMIWTERFQPAGEFELRTPKVDETMYMLPEDTLISHLETDEVMMVETHEIEEDADGIPELVVKGRSLDSFLENRFIEGVYQKKRTMAKNYTPEGACEVLVWNAVDNPSGKDVTREGDFVWTQKDQIPNVSVTHSVNGVGLVRARWLMEGQLYPQLMEIMTRGGLGIRMIRPTDHSSGQVVSVSTALATRGDVTRTPTDPITSLRFDFYNGLDRSHIQSVNPKVAFNRLHGHFDKANYLFSSKDAKTAVEIMTSIAASDVYRNSTEEAYEGLRRRVLAFDAGTPDIPAEPEKPDDLKSNATKAQKAAHAKAIDDWLDEHAAWKNKKDTILSNFKDDYQDDVQAALKKQRRISMFTGDISPIAPYKYKTDYNLGDIVTLYGDFGLVQRMVVDEYIRTDDSNGDRGYPGLTLP